MKHKKGLLALLLSTIITFSSLGFTGLTAYANDTVLSQGAWYESMYIEWRANTATEYNVYYKESSSDTFTKVDDELVRNITGNNYRVDVLGLKGDTSYDVKVVPVINGSEGDAVINYTATPMAYDRSGFAFYGSSDCPGAYNSDGTLEDNALVIYLTEENKKTVYNGKSIKSILGGLNSLNDGNPVVIRVIGKVNPLSSSDLNPGMWKNTCGVTIEGVGPGAGFYGWGIGSGDNRDTEFRNMNFADYVEDALGFENAERLWIHNNTFYSGYNPKDSTSERDKLHGDGSCDLRECDTVTVSYNHFNGTDKTSLIGSSSSNRESTGNITFHHNFFDGTSQRTPRVRWHNIHVYNNYYYNTKNYGVGATCNSSIFAENNYFEDAASPFLTSSQGGYASKFSDNEGGVIKAYNNVMVNTRESVEGVDYFNSPSREYRMTAADFTTIKGGWTYNNFDANGYIGNMDYVLHSPEEAKEIAKNLSGSIKTATIESEDVVTPPSVTGNVTAKYYYISPTSGSTGTSFGGVDGTGSFFSGSGTCEANSATGYRGTEEYYYPGSFSTGGTISFTTTSAAKFTIVASTSGNTPQRATLTNEANPDAVYHGTFQTGNKGNDVLTTIDLLEAGTYSFKSSSNIDIHYIEVEEYDGQEPTTESTESTTVTSSESTTETSTESTTETSTEASTESSTETSTEISTESSSETTTEAIVADKGDADLDGRVNFNDAILVLRSGASTYELNEQQKANADMNDDSSIDFRDAILILRKAASSYSPVSEPL